jgi:hypothetical protein
MVEDMDRYLAGFRERAVAMGALETVPGRFRRVVIADPEGNRVTFGGALGTARIIGAWPQIFTLV